MFQLVLRWTAFGLTLLLALGALPCGLMLFLDPSGGSMGMTLSMLRGSPFADFLIPGFILFTVNGIGAVVAAWAALRDLRWAPAAALGMGILLMGWMVGQIFWLGWGSWLQTLYLIWGLLLVLLGDRWITAKRNSKAR